MNSKETEKPDWLDPIGLEEEYGISRNRQKALRKDRILPFHKRGSYIRYKRKAIDEWWENGKVV